MEKKVIVTYVDTDEVPQNRKIAEIIAGGFYEFLKSEGFLRKSADRERRIEQVLENAKRIHDASAEA